MFPTYNSLAEVPEAFREHYVMKGGKAVAEVAEDHPLVANNARLVSEKTQAEKERDDAKREAASASASTLPRGHEAVPKADAELVRAVKAAGVESVDAFNTLKTEHGDYKTTAEDARREKHAASVGAAMGWDKEKTARLVPKVFDLSQVEVREVDGKQTVIAKVKGAGDALVEKPFADVVKTTAELSDLLPSLAGSQGGVAYLPQSPGGRAPSGDKYENIRKDVKRREEGRQGQSSDLHPMFQRPNAAAS